MKTAILLLLFSFSLPQIQVHAYDGYVLFDEDDDEVEAVPSFFRGLPELGASLALCDLGGQALLSSIVEHEAGAVDFVCQAEKNPTGFNCSPSIPFIDLPPSFRLHAINRFFELQKIYKEQYRNEFLIDQFRYFEQSFEPELILQGCVLMTAGVYCGYRGAKKLLQWDQR